GEVQRRIDDHDRHAVLGDQPGEPRRIGLRLDSRPWVEDKPRPCGLGLARRKDESGVGALLLYERVLLDSIPRRGLRVHHPDPAPQHEARRCKQRERQERGEQTEQSTTEEGRAWHARTLAAPPRSER